MPSNSTCHRMQLKPQLSIVCTLDDPETLPPEGLTHHLKRQEKWEKGNVATLISQSQMGKVYSSK